MSARDRFERFKAQGGVAKAAKPDVPQVTHSETFAAEVNKQIEHATQVAEQRAKIQELIKDLPAAEPTPPTPPFVLIGLEPIRQGIYRVLEVEASRSADGVLTIHDIVESDEMTYAYARSRFKLQAVRRGIVR